MAANPNDHAYFMRLAYEEAKKGESEGGIPIGSILVYEGKVLGRGHNQRVQMKSSIRHGEMDCLENAGRLPTSIYRNAVLYTTLSPCPMCSGTCLLYKIPTVVVAENKNFMGEEELLKSRGVNIIVLQDKDCIEMMSNWIEKNPKLWNEDIYV